MFNLANEYFQTVFKKDATLKYPCLMWDFMYKGGASQAHPHSISNFYFYFFVHFLNNFEF